MYQQSPLWEILAGVVDVMGIRVAVILMSVRNDRSIYRLSQFLSHNY